MLFAEAAVKTNNKEKTRTTNGMKARVTTASSLVDLFNCIGSSRGTSVARQFAAAFAEDEDKALRILLWSRDILQGAGERQQFRTLLQLLESYDHELAAKLIPKIPELGRWDDLFAYNNPANKEKAFEHYAKALALGDQLAAKWAPREKSSKRKIAYEFRKYLGLTPKEYRKFIVHTTDVVENKMCAKDWSSINFSHIPSIAAFRYQEAFKRHTPSTYSKYLNNLTSSNPTEKVKVNAKALYPHDIVMSILRGQEAVAQAQWDALPNFCDDTNILPMIDVSGSMGFLGSSGLCPIHIATSLGMYLAEKNSSDFKDLFLTFSNQPKLQLLKGNLKSRLQQLARAEWGMNTDLNKAFNLVLDVAVNNKVSQKDMPEIILILSDMEFDRNEPDTTAFKMIKDKYKAAGYEVPNIVFWNLSKNTNHNAVRFSKTGAALISGFSPSIMKSVLSNNLEEFTPENVMLETIMSDRYKISK